MRVAVIGRTSILYKSALSLLEQGHEIVLIGTCKESPEYKIKASDYIALAQKLNIPYFNTPRINSEEVISLLKKAKPDIAISMNWLTIIGEKVIECFPYGMINAHPGDLPKYRGNACPNWAIINGESRISTTLHLIEPNRLDSGPIILKDHFPMSDSTTIGEIYDYLERSIPMLFCEALKKINSNSVLLISQKNDKSSVLRCYPRVPSDSYIRWSEHDSEHICRIIRASSEPFSGAYTYWAGEKLIIWKAHSAAFENDSLYMPGQVISINKQSGNVDVAAKDSIVVISEVSYGDYDRVSPAEVIKSTRTRLGFMLEDEIFYLRNRIIELERLIRNE